MNNNLNTELRTLEESLWRTATRFDPKHMNRILADDFFEFGRSGKRYTREQCLKVATIEINCTLPLKEFTVHRIDTDTVLVTYISEVRYDTVELSNRSSLWSRIDGVWKLRFHQGTPIESTK